MKNLVAALIALLIAGCSSYTDDMRQIRGHFISGTYKEALSSLDSSDLPDQERNRLLYLLEKAMIYDRMSLHKKSRALFLSADRQVDRLYRRSLAGDALSFVYNDSAMDYQGEDYEKVAIHTMLALSFLGSGQLNQARVEARAINTRLTEINNFYKDNKNHYKEDAFARLLAGLIYEAKGELDSALVEYRGSLKAYRGSYRKHFDTNPPDALLQSFIRLAKFKKRKDLIRLIGSSGHAKNYLGTPGKDSTLIVIHESSVITPKKSEDFVFTWDGKPMRISFPVIRRRRLNVYGKTGVSVDGKIHRANLVQNMDAIASRTLEDARGRYIAKMAARVVLKDQISQKIGKAIPGADLLTSIYGAVTETADTRSWAFLPSAFFITRINLPPGKHSVKIVTNGRTSSLRRIDFKPGEFIFLRDF